MCRSRSCKGWQDLRDVSLSEGCCPECGSAWSRVVLEKAAAAQGQPPPKRAAANKEESSADTIARFQQLVLEGKISGVTAEALAAAQPAAEENAEQEGMETDAPVPPPTCRETQREFNKSFADLQRLYKTEADARNQIRRKQKELEAEERKLAEVTEEIEQARARAKEAAARLTEAFQEFEASNAEKKAKDEADQHDLKEDANGEDRTARRAPSARTAPVPRQTPDEEKLWQVFGSVVASLGGASALLSVGGAGPSGDDEANAAAANARTLSMQRALNEALARIHAGSGPEGATPNTASPKSPSPPAPRQEPLPPARPATATGGTSNAGPQQHSRSRQRAQGAQDNSQRASSRSRSFDRRDGNLKSDVGAAQAFLNDAADSTLPPQQS